MLFIYVTVSDEGITCQMPILCTVMFVSVSTQGTLASHHVRLCPLTHTLYS